MSVACFAGDVEMLRRVKKTLSDDFESLTYIWDYPDNSNNQEVAEYIISTFLQDVARANLLTYYQQYPSEKASLIVPDLSGNTSAYKTIQLYKKLRAMRYNLVTNIGEQKDLNNCYQKLKMLIEHYSYKIISAMPEYEAAEWI